MKNSTKSRTPISYASYADESTSKSNRSSYLNESGSTFYEAPEIISTPSTHIADVNSLSDEDIRERFKSVMVCN